MAKKKTYSLEIGIDEFMEALRGFCGKTLYAKGGFCERLTLAKLQQKAKQYPGWYHDTKCAVAGYRNISNYEYLAQMAKTGKWFIADCCGLIKGIRAGYRPDGTVGQMTLEIDEPIETMAASLLDVTDADRTPYGGMIFAPDFSHVAIISEVGTRDIESAPSLNGAKEVALTYQPCFRKAKGGRLPWIDYTHGKKRIDEDGVWGPETTRKAQQEFGTTVDGIVSLQLSRMQGRMPGCKGGWHWNGRSGDGGSELVRALQKWLRVDVDGHMGPQTISALQKKMGTPVDGVLSMPSQCVKAFQHYLNEKG